MARSQDCGLPWSVCIVSSCLTFVQEEEADFVVRLHLNKRWLLALFYRLAPDKGCVAVVVVAVDHASDEALEFVCFLRTQS